MSYGVGDYSDEYLMVFSPLTRTLIELDEGHHPSPYAVSVAMFDLALLFHDTFSPFDDMEMQARLRLCRLLRVLQVHDPIVFSLDL